MAAAAASRSVAGVAAADVHRRQQQRNQQLHSDAQDGRLPLRVVTFDLDDTLWPTGEVVFSANAALRAWLGDHFPGIENEGVEVQVEMKRLRRGWDQTEPGFVVNYGRLRREALLQLAMRAGYGASDAGRCAEGGFAVWLAERQAAAGRLLFDDAVATLEALRAAGLLIGAVTNGNGDPKQIEALAPLFDFVVSAEEAEVALPKPSPRPFEVAMDRAAAMLASGPQPLARGSAADAWLHVGDCLDNDVRAAKSVGIMTAWYTPVIPEGRMTWYSTKRAAGGDDSDALAAMAASTPSGAGSSAGFGSAGSAAEGAAGDEGCVDVRIAELRELVEVVAARR
eukprot:jgi/Tetstr1/431307/TSEL_020999.t1